MHFFVFYSYVDVKKQSCLKPVTGEPYQHGQLRQNDGALLSGAEYLSTSGTECPTIIAGPKLITWQGE